jgi:hypothetical protein
MLRRSRSAPAADVEAETIVPDIMKPVYSALLGRNVAPRIDQERLTRIAKGLLEALYVPLWAEYQNLPEVTIPDPFSLVPEGITLRLRTTELNAIDFEGDVLADGSADVIMPSHSYPLTIGSFSVGGFMRQDTTGRLRPVSHVMTEDNRVVVEPDFGDMYRSLGGIMTPASAYERKNFSDGQTLVVLLEGYAQGLPDLACVPRPTQTTRP